MRPVFGFMTKQISAASTWVNRNIELRLRDFLCAGGNSVKMLIFCMQNVEQIFADLWLKNEVDDVPADHF